jgi:hypothetical protein
LSAKRIAHDPQGWALAPAVHSGTTWRLGCRRFYWTTPTDQGYNYLITFTCCLGSDIRLVPAKMNVTAPELALLFFDHWYCDNSLPLEFVCDHDKLFVSTFWKSIVF